MRISNVEGFGERGLREIQRERERPANDSPRRSEKRIKNSFPSSFSFYFLPHILLFLSRENTDILFETEISYEIFSSDGEKIGILFFYGVSSGFEYFSTI